MYLPYSYGVYLLFFTEYHSYRLGLLYRIITAGRSFLVYMDHLKTQRHMIRIALFGVSFESDKEKNKGAIESNQTNIAYFNRIIDSVTNPSFDVATNLFANYASTDKNSPEYKNSHRIFDAIINVYYPGTDVKKVQPESLKYNITQRVGIILNLLVDVDSRNNNYSTANLTELANIEEEEKKEDPAPKK